GNQRQVLPVGAEHATHDLRVDRLRLVGHARALVQEARPLGRAHAHHRALHFSVVAAPALADVPFAHLVPDLLRLHQHAVEVEDDRLDRQSAWYVLSRYISARSAGPCSTETTSPTKKVWSPASCSSRV